jgi:long-chain acyl-CoA synthetase
VGRIKDLLVPEAGHNVAPEPIERRLVEAGRGIEQAVVVGHGRPFLAAIVTGSIAEAELERVREAVNADLPHYQRIKRAIRIAEPFTVENELLTANGKLRRKAIESRYESEIESMYR